MWCVCACVQYFDKKNLFKPVIPIFFVVCQYYTTDKQVPAGSSRSSNNYGGLEVQNKSWFRKQNDKLQTQMQI